RADDDLRELLRVLGAKLVALQVVQLAADAKGGRLADLEQDVARSVLLAFPEQRLERRFVHAARVTDSVPLAKRADRAGRSISWRLLRNLYSAAARTSFGRRTSSVAIR